MSTSLLASVDLSNADWGFAFEKGEINRGKVSEGPITVEPVTENLPGSGFFFKLAITAGAGGYPGINVAFKQPVDMDSHDVLAVWFKSDMPLNYFQLVFQGSDGVVQDTDLAGPVMGFDGMVNPGKWYRAYVHYKAGGWVRYGEKMNWTSIKSLRFYTWDELLNKRHPVHHYQIGGMMLYTLDEAKEALKSSARIKLGGSESQPIKGMSSPPSRHQLQDEQDYELWVDSGSAIVDRDARLAGGTDRQNLIEIEVAPNEYEFVQLIIRPKDRRLSNVGLKIGDIREVKSGAVLPASAFVWYRAEVVEQKRGALYGSRYYFDPLIEKQAQEVEVGKNSMLVIEVKPDYMQLAGVYEGQIELFCDNGKFQPINIRVQVRRFVMPFAQGLDTQFVIWKAQSPTYDEMGMWDVLAKYRVSPGFMRIHPFTERQTIQVLDTNGTARAGQGLIYGDGAKARLERALHDLNQSKLCTDFQIWGFADTWDWKHGLARNARSFTGWLDRHGFLPVCYNYLIDEPTGDRLDMMRQVVKIYRQANPDYTIMCTTAPKPELYGYIDMWVVPWGSLEPTVASQRQELGERVWVYNAPFSCIGQMPRLIGWICWKYRVNGYLHYAIDYTSSEDLKNNPWNCTGPHHATLFYPIQKTWDNTLDYFANSRQWDWKVPSIRMLQIRDGFEDWEYMTLLKKWINLAKRHGPESRDERLLEEAEKMLGIADSFIDDFTTVTDQADDMVAARAKVAEMIERLRKSLTGERY